MSPAAAGRLVAVLQASPSPGVTTVTFSTPAAAAVTLLVYAALSVLSAGAAAVVYRWYFRDGLPEGLAVLAGVALVALYLNTASLGALVGDPEATLFDDPAVVFFNVVALGVAGAVAQLGRYLGDTIARNAFVLAAPKALEGDVSRVVRTVGRVTAVTLPPADEIGDLESYEPVPAATKAELAEKTLLFPRRLTVDEVRTRLIERVKEDFGVGHVDADLDEDGAVEFFAVGSRMAGVGPTIAPGDAAVAVQADPANSATPGDTVQVWTGGESPQRVTTAELRATAGDAATLVVDEADATTLTADARYRLVTLPAEPRADREFASLLRNADETMAAVTVEAGAPLVGTSVGDVGAVVAAVRPEGGEVQAIPPRGYVFAAGDTVYLVGRPNTLRRFEADATAADDPVAEADESPPGTQPS